MSFEGIVVGWRSPNDSTPNSRYSQDYGSPTNHLEKQQLLPQYDPRRATASGCLIRGARRRMSGRRLSLCPRALACAVGHVHLWKKGGV